MQKWCLYVSIPLLFSLFIFSACFNSSLCFYVAWQQLPLGEALLILKDSWDKDISSSQSQQTHSSRPPDFSLSSLILIISFSVCIWQPRTPSINHLIQGVLSRPDLISCSVLRSICFQLKHQTDSSYCCRALTLSRGLQRISAPPPQVKSTPSPS